MGVIPLSPTDLSLASLLILALAWMSFRLHLGLEKRILISALRTTVQLLLIGFVLRIVFDLAHPAWIALMAFVMLMAAGREVLARQKRKFKGWQGFGLGVTAMFTSSFTITLFALAVVIGTKPWYTPQYAIPLLGMLLGNTMNGISICLDRLTDTAWQQRAVIEQRLMLGQDSVEALLDIRRDSMRAGMIPIINSMAGAGLVSLPGMMTGQILGGSSPLDAVKYQILIMFLIAAGTGFGVMLALRLASRRLFDERHRLRLDCLVVKKGK